MYGLVFPVRHRTESERSFSIVAAGITAAGVVGPRLFSATRGYGLAKRAKEQ
jgi:hypothetical protein